MWVRHNFCRKGELINYAEQCKTTYSETKEFLIYNCYKSLSKTIKTFIKFSRLEPETNI